MVTQAPFSLSPDGPRCRTGVYVPCKTRALPRGMSNVGVYVPWVRHPLAVLNDRLWTRLGPLATNDRPRTMINDRRPKSSKRIAKARTVKAYTYLASPWTVVDLQSTRIDKGFQLAPRSGLTFAKGLLEALVKIRMSLSQFGVGATTKCRLTKAKGSPFGWQKSFPITFF